MCFIGFGDLGCQIYYVKHSKNEKSITKTTKSTVKLIIWKSDFHFHCFSCLKGAKMNPSPDPGDPRDPGDLVHGLQLGTSPTRAGG